jgi:hypothetical protein
MNPADAFNGRPIVRIPVAGPAPNNTLIFVAGWLPQADDSGRIAPGGSTSFASVFAEDTHLLQSAAAPFDLYQIDGFLREKSAEYVAHTKVSATAFLSTIDLTDETGYLCAVDQLDISLDPAAGRIQASARVAELDSNGTEITFAIFVSAWILTFEPRAT